MFSRLIKDLKGNLKTLLGVSEKPCEKSSPESKTYVLEEAGKPVIELLERIFKERGRFDVEVCEGFYRIYCYATDKVTKESFHISLDMLHRSFNDEVSENLTFMNTSENLYVREKVLERVSEVKERLERYKAFLEGRKKGSERQRLINIYCEER